MIDDQQLILFFYADGQTDAERSRVAAALAADPQLAQHYATLRAQLERLAAPPAAPVGADTLQRWHDSLADVARADYAREVSALPNQRPRAMPWALAASVALAVGLTAVLMWRGTAPDAVPGVELVAATPERPVFERALTVHFTDSRLALASLPAASSQTRSELLSRIVAQNRLHETVARQRGELRVARVLRAFEPVLLRLADEQVSAADADALSAQLAFELDAMLTKFGRAASDTSTSF